MLANAYVRRDDTEPQLVISSQPTCNVCEMRNQKRLVLTAAWWEFLPLSSVLVMGGAFWKWLDLEYVTLCVAGINSVGL